MDKGSQSGLQIERMQEGGFLVRVLQERMGEFQRPVFASTTIEEALVFIKDMVKPIPSEKSDGK